MLVTEFMDGIPVDDSVRQIKRDEKLLLRWPDPGTMKIWRKYDLLGAIHLPVHHVAGNFSPPQGVFRSEYIHIEYQRMDGRQPFYHRNTDADEITYQVVGDRTLISELGSVDLAVGDLARIPVGVSHDNFGAQDVHIIFYIPQGVLENVFPYRTTEARIPPFPGWEPKDSMEFITEHLGEVGSDVSTHYTDEKMLLENAENEAQRIGVLRTSGGQGSEWLYKSQNVWLGLTSFLANDGKTYTRHRMAEEVQIQMKGQRNLITQRGILHIEPGDFVSIPIGCAFTSVAHEENVYITVLMRYAASAMKQFTKIAEEVTEGMVEKARRMS